MSRLSTLAALSLAAAVVALAPAPATAGQAPAPAAAAPQKAQKAQKSQLVFFMNPNGAPCQMQDRILQEMSGELRGKVDVVYYKTTTPADIARFQQYGIRSLPTLMLTDAGGKEIRRATPGIQSAAQVRQLIGS